MRQSSPPQTDQHTPTNYHCNVGTWYGLLTRDVIGIDKPWILGANGSHGIYVILKILLCLRSESPVNLKFSDYNCINYSNEWFFFSTSVWSEYGICNLSVYDTVYLNLEAERNTVAGTASVIGLWTCWTNQDSQNNTAKSGFNSHGKDSVKYPWNMSSRREKLKHGKGHNNTFFLVSALFIGSYSEYGVQSSVNEHFVFK